MKKKDSKIKMILKTERRGPGNFTTSPHFLTLLSIT